MSKIAVLTTSAIAILILAFNLIIEFEQWSALFNIGLILFAVSALCVCKAIDWAKELDEKTEELMRTPRNIDDELNRFRNDFNDGKEAE